MKDCKYKQNIGEITEKQEYIYVLHLLNWMETSLQIHLKFTVSGLKISVI